MKYSSIFILHGLDGASSALSWWSKKRIKVLGISLELTWIHFSPKKRGCFWKSQVDYFLLNLKKKIVLFASIYLFIRNFLNNTLIIFTCKWIVWSFFIIIEILIITLINYTATIFILDFFELNIKFGSISQFILPS